MLSGKDYWLFLYATSPEFKRYLRNNRIKQFFRNLLCRILTFIPHLYLDIMPFFAKSYEECVSKIGWAYKWCEKIDMKMYGFDRDISEGSLVHSWWVEDIGHYYTKVNYGRRFL